MKKITFYTTLAIGLVATVGWFRFQQPRLSATEEKQASFREAMSQVATRPEPSETGVRVNYFNSPWERVLRDVADQAGLTLIMQKQPSGRFARRDKATYQIDDALQILNESLERDGFRLVRQEQYLVLLHLDSVRTRYARPVLRDSQHSARSQAASDSSDVPPVRSASFSGRRAPVRTASAVSIIQDERGNVRGGDASNPPIRSTEESPSFSETLEIPRHRKPEQQTEEASPRAADLPVRMESVSLRHQEVADVARSIYLVFENRAQLQPKGLNDLPSFAVMPIVAEGTVDQKPLFTIGIDRENQRLLIEAPGNRIAPIVKVIHELDQNKNADGETVRLLPNNGVDKVTARELNDQLHKMVVLRDPAAAPAAASDDFAGYVRAQQEGEQPSVNAGVQDEALNLRGEVTIQAIPELGILIISGRGEDVAKVSGIVEQLEKMSIGSLPTVHLQPLRNVSSERLSELLTSVYDRLAELRERGDDTQPQRIAFFPVVQPNSLLILAPDIEMPDILDQVEQLDIPLTPADEFQVVRLKNDIASQVVTALEGFFGEDIGGLGTRVRAIADPRTNAVIIHGGARDIAEVVSLIEKLDRDDPGAVNQLRVITLSNAVAEELATVINDAILSVTSPAGGSTQGGFQGGNTQSAQELRETKSIALEFLATDDEAQKLVRSGILIDVRVNAEPRTNALLVIAPESSMEMMEALIRKLDGEPSATASIKVFPLKNSDASQAVELLETLFESQNNEDQIGIKIAGTQGSPNSLVPVTFSADVRTNTVLAVGGEEALSVVEAVLIRLDSEALRNHETSVIPLKNAPAELVSEAIDGFLQQQQSLQDSSADLISNIERLRKEVIVQADTNSNSLIVSASPEYYDTVIDIIERLDAQPPEVVIQALMVEVLLDNTDEFGIELGFQDPLLLSRSVVADAAADLVTLNTTQTTASGGTVQNQTLISQAGTPGFNFNSVNPLGNNVAPGASDVNRIGAQGLSNFSLGRSNSDLGYGGFVFSASSDAVSVLVRALAARRNVHVLTRPQIRATHNNEAIIRVGSLVPRTTGTNIVNQVVSPDVVDTEVGITLQVTPRITSDGQISMNVYAQKSALSDRSVPIFTDVTTGSVVSSPIIDITDVDTTVTVPSGQTIVIGGMITKRDATLERKVPWLGDVPLLGQAFRYDSTRTERTELIVFLTPRLILTDSDAEVIKQIESERTHMIESEVEEIHGPIFSVPPADGFEAGGQYIPHNDQGFMPVPESVVPTQPATQLPDMGARFPGTESNDASDSALPHLSLPEAGGSESAARSRAAALRGGDRFAVRNVSAQADREPDPFARNQRADFRSDTDVSPETGSGEQQKSLWGRLIQRNGDAGQRE